jgi:hypothetical protein
MENDKCNPKPVIEQYKRKCEIARHPLNRCQTGLLESTLRDIIMNNKALSGTC